jgi:RNA polymerase sigma factor for flagellar operon FliA
MTERTRVPERPALSRVPGRPPAGSDGLAVEQALDELWNAFTRERSQALRGRLVLHYAPMVKYVAGRVGTGLPQHVDAGDLVQAGIFGLIDAIDRFEPERGWKFETYAINRVRGAILDDLRAQDWVPRSVRSRARAVQAALGRLESSLRRSPTDAEVAAEAELTLPELHALYREMSMTSVIALDDLVGGDGESGGLSAADVLADEHAPDPVAVLESEESRRLLAEAVAGLPERDRTVVTLYYFENLTLSEIGTVLGVTESRICQLHTRAVLRLRTRIAEVTGDRVPDPSSRPRARRGRA